MVSREHDRVEGERWRQRHQRHHHDRRGSDDERRGVDRRDERHRSHAAPDRRSRDRVERRYERRHSPFAGANGRDGRARGDRHARSRSGSDERRAHRRSRDRSESSSPPPRATPQPSAPPTPPIAARPSADAAAELSPPTEAYTNPYGDERIDEQFVWRKKDEKLRRMGVEVDDSADAQKLRRNELRRELEKAKHRRLEREQERAAWEEEQARVARDKEAEENAEWEQREEFFHAKNFYTKQAVRLRERRPQPADFLARNLRLDLDDVAPDDSSPYAILYKISVERLEDVLRYVDDELRFSEHFPAESAELLGEQYGAELRDEYWQSQHLLAEHALSGARAAAASSEKGGGAAASQVRSGVHQTVERDVEAVLGGKTRLELRALQRQIEDTLLDSSEDAEYWQGLLERVRLAIARARLDEINRALVEYKRRHGHRASDDAALAGGGGAEGEDEEEAAAMAGEVGVEPAGKPATAPLNEEEMLRRESRRALGENEERFADEVALERSKYAWNDKYRPRKPRYFNRVHTGYEWNKYNQTHYDHDNPPPKTVQGYKFNIFYPDLIDRSQAPTFRITKTDNPDVCILRFQAGPPYEDIAFKIVNREWEHSHKRGFRCTFDRGILHLWFNFRRLRYRR